MEKIQAAIAKARATRDGVVSPLSTIVDPAPTVNIPTTGASDAVDAAWSNLTPYIPDMAELERSRIVTLAGGRAASPFDVMRTKLLQQMRANNWRRLAITSPSAACGKSMITLNLGFSLARQTDIRTIVAELDLRRPSLGKTLGVTQPHSFARVLAGEAGLAENALRHSHNLMLATNQSSSRNPAELLNGAGVPSILAGIEATYAPDLMIFDMPPMLVSDDAMAFIGQVDCVLLVAAAEATTIKEIDACERELASQTNVMGIVLNKCRYMGPEYGYSYYG